MSGWHPSTMRSVALLAYAGVFACLKIWVFTGSSLIDTCIFMAVLASIFFATTDNVAPWASRTVLAAILLFVLPVVGLANTFYLDVTTQVAIYAVLALGLNIVVGLAGLLDLGFIAFFALGAYLWAILGSTQASMFLPGSFPLPAEAFFLVLPIGVGVAALAGILLGLPVLRLRGDYLAIVTLGFGEMVRILANNLDKPVNITNGPQGIAGIAQPLNGLAIALATDAVPEYKWQALIYYFFVLCLIGCAILVNRRLDASRIGRAWVAIREDEIAAQAMGIPLVATKLIAFATGAAMAGGVGVLFAAKQTYVSPESFDFNQSIAVLAMIVLGGLGSIRGAVLGAAAVTLLNLQVLKVLSAWLNTMRADGVEFLGFSFANLPAQFEPSKYERLIFGIILIIMMLYRPQGLVPAKRKNIGIDVDSSTGKPGNQA
ncbi:MAG: high-affinity branched-chain amino acid ABC transporter permease LivM [Hyphomicrobiales bacterium]|nr:high-affinity branched-chain amino acid ABC transporter permease LivM [Hyphomicrobiales bacterium]